MTVPLLLAASFLLPSARAAEEAAPSEFQKSAALFALKCAKCHTIGSGRRVGPDLQGVLSRRPRDWVVGFIMDPDSYLDKDPVARKLLEENNGVRMENEHLARPQAEGMAEYIEHASAAPPAPEPAAVLEEEPLAKKLRMPDEGYSPSWPGVALVLLLLAGAAGLFRAGLPAGSAAFLVGAVLAGYWSFGGRRHYHLLGNQQGYEPPQPIAFSHAQHAGKLGISCFYCHHGAEKSDVAGVPSVNICMNCHAAVHKSADASGPSSELALLTKVWESRRSEQPESLAWNRVHRLPDYVHFSHQVHVADNIQCQECHGPVQAMARMRQAASLSMGWCVQCHRETPGAAPTHWKRAGGPLDCAACHW